ncbi:MAG: hypothetical protein OHK0032_12390 [Thermodesulfovibrionales bacterium]
MGKAVVSFEDTTIRVIYAASKGKRPVVKDALTLRNEQFDDFLEKEKTKEFIVVNTFKDFFQDTILIPPVKKRYLKKLIEAEVRKRSGLKDFSFIHAVSGEKLVDNRRMKEIFVFAVKNEDIKDIINRFASRGKVVSALYPDVFSIASQIDSTEPVLCVSEAGFNKNLFLIKDGRIQFVRTAQSLEHGISDLDVQNISMTVNYCRQAMRVNPSLIMLTGGLCSDYNATSPSSIPISCLSHQSKLFLDFAAPLSALYVDRGRDIDLLTTEYKNLYRTGLFLRYSTSLFLALSVISLSYAGFTIKDILGTRSKLDSIRRGLPDVRPAVSIYDTRKSELSVYMPFIKSLKDASKIPDIQRVLYLLSDLKQDNIRIDSINITASDNVLKIEMRGLVRTEGFADAQMHYQRMVDSISPLNGFSIKGHGLELKDKSFHLDMEYQTARNQGIGVRGQQK